MTASYDNYLQSDYWKQVSDAVKKRDGYKCRVCNSPHDLQAHHRDYSHRGKELDYKQSATHCVNGVASVAGVYHRRGMKHFRIFYRVPATEKHASFLSETIVEAADKISAVARFLATNPGCTVSTVFNGI